MLYVKKKQKLQYAPGGSTGREEYMPKIPKITACHYHSEKCLLIVSFIDTENKIFKINGFGQDRLDIEYVPKSYKSPFICT